MMVRLIWSKNFHRWTKEFGHAFLVLIVTIVISILLGEFAFMRGWEAIYRGLFRFFRIAFFLCLSLLLLSPIFSNLGFVMQRRKGMFLQIKGKQELEIHPIKHWLFRPFQGIGIGLLFATKLLGVLQLVITTSAVGTFAIIRRIAMSLCNRRTLDLMRGLPSRFLYSSLRSCLDIFKLRSCSQC